MGDRPRLSDETLKRLDIALIETYGYPENVVKDEETKTRTKIRWVLDEIESDE
jgi:hypothetical protein